MLEIRGGAPFSQAQLVDDLKIKLKEVLSGVRMWALALKCQYVVGSEVETLTGLVDQKKQEHSVEFKPGQVTVLDFWNSWCPPCKKQMADSQAIAFKNKENDQVRFVAINTDATLEGIALD